MKNLGYEKIKNKLGLSCAKLRVVRLGLKLSFELEKFQDKKQAHQCISCVLANKFYKFKIPSSLSLYPNPFIPIHSSLSPQSISLSISLYPCPFIPIPISLSLYPNYFIPFPSSLSLYPYPFIPIPLSLSLYPYPLTLSLSLYPYPFIPKAEKLRDREAN